MVVKHVSGHVRAPAKVSARGGTRCTYGHTHNSVHLNVYDKRIQHRPTYMQPLPFAAFICLGEGSRLHMWWRRAGGRENRGMAHLFALKGLSRASEAGRRKNVSPRRSSSRRASAG